MDKELFDFYKAALSGEQSAPLCAEYKTLWRQCGDDRERLMRLALQQQAQPFVATYAYQNRGVSREYLKQHFGDYINGYTFYDCDGVAGYTYGMFVDWDYENDLVADKDIVSILWTVGANVVIPKCKCPTLYVSNRSDIHIIGDGFNTLRVYLFDSSRVTFEDLDDESSVVVFKYSDNAQVDTGKYCLGKVKQFNKELRL